MTDLEPAERNPKELRRTALTLVLVALVGGIWIFYSYSKHQERQGIENADRPSYRHQVMRNIQVVTKGGTVRDLGELEGKVWVAAQVTAEGSEKSVGTVGALKWLKGKFEDSAVKPVVVLFVVDVDAADWEKLAGVIPELGPEVWRVAAGEGKTPVREFLKNQMRFGMLPREVDGEWEFDSNLILLDQQRKVRGWGDQMNYDFETVAEMERKFAAAKRDYPGEELLEPPMTTERFRKILGDAVRFVIEHPPENPEK